MALYLSWAPLGAELIRLFHRRWGIYASFYGLSGEKYIRLLRRDGPAREFGGQTIPGPGRL